jgi:peptide/nickel transport system ATP-binding protein
VTEAPALAALDDVSLTYDTGHRRLPALDRVSLTIGRGEVVGLVGESGCGKSTLAYLLLGYVGRGGRVSHGRVRLDGLDLLGLDRRRLGGLRGRRVGLVPQNPSTALSPGMPVGEQVSEVLEAHGMGGTADAVHARVVDLFAAVGLPAPAASVHRYPHQLSGGQQQRVAIAMALACDPDLVVLDEPTTGLDVTTQAQIVALLAELRERRRLSMLYVSHDLALLAQIADRMGVMYAGHLVELAHTADLFSRPAHPYTRALLASMPRPSTAGGRLARPLRGHLRHDELPAGCAFAPRCDFAEPACFAEPQSLGPATSAGHLVACRRWTALPGPEPLDGEMTAPRAPTAGTPLLALEGVTLAYRAHRLLGAARPRPVVHDLTLQVMPGEIVALVGESGSGKSTVARAISGLLPPVAGRLLFDGRLLPGQVARRSPELCRRIQYIFQNPDASLNPRARVGEILARPLALFFRSAGAGARAAVEAALDDVQLDRSHARRFPDELSGGERQRVAIARALVARPDLLICDEILSALDVSVQAGILALLDRLRRERRVAILFIAHDLAVVQAVADRLGVLYRGVLLETGTTESVFRPPYHPYTRLLLSAIPSLERRLSPDPGAARAAGAEARGCPFAGRCAWQPGPVCDEQRPPWRDAGTGARIRCHVPIEELATCVREEISR